VTGHPDEELERRLAEHLEAFHDFRQDLKTKYPRYAAMKQPDPARIEDVQKFLDGQTMLLEYFVGGGFLTAGEVYGLDLACDCVVLSACKVGLGQSVRGEGVMGLTRAFMYAGSRCVVVSLWSVADEATLALMKHFYTNLEKGMAKDEALRQARLLLMEEGFIGPSGTEVDGSHPFFWAPFVIYGDAS